MDGIDHREAMSWMELIIEMQLVIKRCDYIDVTYYYSPQFKFHPHGEILLCHQGHTHFMFHPHVQLHPLTLLSI